MFVFVFLYCLVLCRQRPLRRTDHSPIGVLPSFLIRLRNLWCEEPKVLTKNCRTTDDDDDDALYSLVIKPFLVYLTMLYISVSYSVGC
jgi:hypothetical protein